MSRSVAADAGPEDRDIFHAESARTSFIDAWTHRAMIARLGQLPEKATIVDVGCSAGYLLEDLRHTLPEANLVGVDVAPEGLRMAQANVPDATLLQADACELSLDAESADAAVSANVLEHVSDDQQALAEIFRILRPGARAVIVVPYGPHIYDYYDRYAQHMRRYDNGELTRKAEGVGFETLEDVYLGAPLYPAFWLVKQRNRRRYGHLRGDALSARVARDIARTKNSKAGYVACRIEEWLLSRSIRVPFGIRGLTVLLRPTAPDGGQGVRRSP